MWGQSSFTYHLAPEVFCRWLMWGSEWHLLAEVFIKSDEGSTTQRIRLVTIPMETVCRGEIVSDSTSERSAPQTTPEWICVIIMHRDTTNFKEGGIVWHALQYLNCLLLIRWKYRGIEEEKCLDSGHCSLGFESTWSPEDLFRCFVIRLSVCSGLRGQKRALGSLDLELRDSCELPCGTGKWAQVPWENNVCNPWIISPVPVLVS